MGGSKADMFENGVVSNGSQTNVAYWCRSAAFENGVVSNGSQTYHSFVI